MIVTSINALVNRLRRTAFWNRQHFERNAWLLWTVFVVGIAIHILVKPHRSITHIYRAATQAWWSGQDLYGQGIHGFLYLPASAFLYTPFAYGPPLLLDLAWRLICVALFTLGVARLARLVAPALASRLTALALLAIIPSAGIDVVRAQSEMIMVALMFLAAVETAAGRWGWSALCLCLAVAIKPLALVALLLCALVFPPLRWRVALGMAGVLLVPFLHPDTGYVVAQYTGFAQKMLTASDPGIGRWNELAMMLRKFGLVPQHEAMTAVRAAAALAAAGLAVVAARRHNRATASVLVLSLAVCYLLVFNPRTEDGSYVNLAVLAALSAGVAWWIERRTILGWALLALCLGLGTQVYGEWIYRPTDIWLKPLLGLIYIAFLSARILRPAAVPHPEPVLSEA